MTDQQLIAELKGALRDLALVKDSMRDALGVLDDLCFALDEALNSLEDES